MNILHNLQALRGRYLSRKVIFAADIVLSLIASATVLLVMNMLISGQVSFRSVFLPYMAISLAATLVMEFATGDYKIIIRHLSVKDVLPFFYLSLIKEVALMLAMTILLGAFSKVMLVICGLDFFATFFLLWLTRIAMILVYQYLEHRDRDKQHTSRVLVYGISEKSVATLVRLQNSTNYKIVGFLTRDLDTKGTLIDQLPVYCYKTEGDFEDLLKKVDFNAILFAKETEAQALEDTLITYCNHRGIKTLIVPSVDEVVEGQTIIRPREIKVEDLLGREEIKISMDAIEENFRGKTVLVTGAAGSIGSELCRQLASFGVGRLILYDNAETPMHNLRLELEDKFRELSFVPVIGDVRQERRLDFAFRTYHPQVVFHAAAYKHVPLMEENPCEAVLVNVTGTRQVADKCLMYGVEKMVMISTDKAVNPTNIMGCTKRLAEIYVQSLGLALERGEREGSTVFVTTRFGNVLGSNGSVIPRFREQIAAGGPVTVTHPEINRFFMTIPEACRLVMEAATMARKAQIFVFDMGKPVKIDSLARRMITLAGFVPDKDIKIKYSGLRPGEKLYEEVLATEENTLPTFHERIRIAKVREYDFGEATAVMDELERLSRAVEIPEMVRLMKQTVPEYVSSANSKFSAIDKELNNK